MPKKVGGLEQLLIQELQDLLDAEKQLVRALPKMAKSVSDQELETLFRDHLEMTKTQVQRLEEVFRSMNMPARGRPSKGMKGLVEEGQEMIGEGHEDMVLDSALTGSARKVGHYEIAGYENARSLAQQLGLKEAAQKLEETLREEIATEKRLTQVSKRLLKSSSAMRSSEASGEEEEARGRRMSSQRGSARGSSRAASARGGSRTSPQKRSGTAAKGRGSSSRSGGARKGGSAEQLTDHEEIRQWAEERGAHPACVRGTGGGEDIGMIRLDFPGYSGEESLEQISWDEWFEKFDQNNLALAVQRTTTTGEQSNFNKLVRRQGQGRPKARSAH